jgi:hypothetical protein
LAFAPETIHLGPARIFLDVTNPATGTPPAWLTHTTGVPADGDEVGVTDGSTDFEYDPKKVIIMGEQFYSGVDAALSEEACSITFTAKESTAIALRTGFDGTGAVEDGTRIGFYGGAGTGAFAVRKQSVVVTARKRTDPTKYIVIMLYKAVLEGKFTYTFQRKKETMWKMKLTGLADTTRDPGDNLYQFSVEKDT